MGTYAWGDTEVWSWDDDYKAKAKEAFDMTLSKGINTLDTAEIYGNGERYAKTRLRINHRHDCILANVLLLNIEKVIQKILFF